jgi:hypothetical protein
LLFILRTPHRAWNMCYGSFLRGNHVGRKRPINTHGSHWLSVPTICTGHIIRADPKLAHYIRIHFTFGFHLFEGSIDHHFLGLCLFFHGHSSFHQVILFVFEGLRSFVVSYNLSEDLISVILILRRFLRKNKSLFWHDRHFDLEQQCLPNWRTTRKGSLNSKLNNYKMQSR